MLRFETKDVRTKLTLILLLLFPILVLGNRIEVESSGRALSRVLARSRPGDTLVLESGVYRGKFFVPPKVVLLSEKLHEAILDGSGHNRAVIMQNGSTLYGISVRGARVGVYSEGIDNAIIGCKIYNNHHSGIVAVISLPKIKDNLIFRNQGSGITLWEIDNDTVPVTHNTIVYNTNHGISVGGGSNVSITNNIIAFNHKLKIQVNEDSRISQEFNNYYFNVEINELLPQNNYSFDPLFINPLKNDFRLQDRSRCINSGEGGTNVGSEIFNKYYTN